MQLLLFYLLIIVIQGFLATLFGQLPVPDLFLASTLTLLRRLPNWRLLLVAYSVGLLQDIIGYGYLGLHALGLAGGVLFAIVIAAQLSEEGLMERILVVLFACLGKWAIFLGLLFWLSNHNPLRQIKQIILLETTFTLISSLILFPLANWFMERNNTLPKKF